MAADAVQPAQLVVPRTSDGRQTFKLELLASANGVSEARGHDALADALATLGLCRLVQERAPELWHRFVRFSKKAAVADFIESEDAFILTEFFQASAFHTPVVLVGPDPDQPNGRVCLDLREDLARLEAMSDLELQAAFAQTPCPMRRLRVNAAPILTALYDVPDHLLPGCDVGALEERARLLKSDDALCTRLVAAYMASRTPFPVSPHLEERIYDGFPGRDDELRMAAFHDAAWEDRVVIVNQFEDERLRWFGLRLIYLEARWALPQTLKLDVERRLVAQLTGDGSGCLTIEGATAETERLISEGTCDDGLLARYRIYLGDRAVRLAAYQARLAA